MTTTLGGMNGDSLDLLSTKEVIDLEQLKNEELEKVPEGPTLLWRSAARTITLATGAATFSIRAGLGVGKWGLNAGRRTTHGIIGVNQSVLESVLRAAGRDVASSTHIALRQDEADRIIDRWIASIHGTLSAASVLAASGFYLAESALYWTSDSSLNGLHFLNALFGSTETSRAVAAIISLMKKELYKPGIDGAPSEMSTFNLLTTVASFLFLQRSSRRKTEIEWRDSGGDATVWDIVIDDKGFRADVIGTRRQTAVITSSTSIVQSPLADEPNDDFAIVAGQLEDDLTSNIVALSAHDQTSLSDEEIRQRIMSQLPVGTKATVTTDTMLVKTVRVNIHGSESANIEAPPGMVMVSEHPNFDNGPDGQVIIFRTASKVQSKAEIKINEPLRLTALDTAESTDPDDGITMRAPTSRVLTQPEPTESEGAPNSTQLSQSPQQVEQHLPSYMTSGPLANQKKARRAASELPLPPQSTRIPQALQPKSRREKTTESAKTERNEKSGVIKKALKSLSPVPSTAALNRVLPGASKTRSNSVTGFTNSLSETLRPLTRTRENSRKPVFHVPTTQPVTPLISPGRMTSAAEGAGTSYFTVHEQRRESTYSQTDTYSVHSNESRPPSPTMSRTHLRASNSISKTKSQTEISLLPNTDPHAGEGSLHHRRSRSFVPSLYSMGTKNSAEDPIVLAPRTPVPTKSIFEDNKMLMALAKDGKVPGQFPSAHLVLTVRRFVRFASAAYGESFLRWMGLSANPHLQATDKRRKEMVLHVEHQSFSHYTGLPPETIVKSSHVDPQGMSNTYSDGFSPLIHFVSIDLEAKAIVLTCRGTLGFEDLLTDMACDYADLYWQGQAYKVHRGIRDSARRLMEYSGNSQIMAVLKASLEEYPEFGLVLVGHSLGGAVAAVLAIMLAEPSKHQPGEMDAPSFVTATRPKLLPSEAHVASSKQMPPITLPPGRPIHVYAFGSPAAVSSSLRIATRGLITSVINANDIVPYLSLGTLHDFRAVTSRLKEDFSGAFGNIKQRAVERISSAISSYFSPHSHHQAHSIPPPPGDLGGDGLGEDTWMWNELAEMRKVMNNEKLYPPGEIFTLESTRVFDRDPDETTATGVGESRHYAPLGRPATRLQFKWVKDVERRFAEVRFGRSMFHEHSPTAYENNLSALERGVCEDG